MKRMIILVFLFIWDTTIIVCNPHDEDITVEVINVDEQGEMVFQKSLNLGNYSGAPLQTVGIGVIAGTRCASTPALTPFMRAKQSSPLFAKIYGGHLNSYLLSDLFGTTPSSDTLYLTEICISASLEQ